MSGFLYFLPNCRASQVNEEVLKRFGLLHIRDHKDQPLHAREVVANGPDGLPGVVLGVADRWQAEAVKQSPELAWVRFPKPHAECQAWLGWMKDKPLPKPADLARVNQLPGEVLPLADGEKWLVPIARDFEGHCKLPRAYDLDEETGEWVSRKVRREYAKLWGHATGFYESQTMAYVAALEAGQDSFAFEIPDGEALVSDSLATNYRVSQRELATLGVLVSGIIQQVAEVLIDAHTDHAKKK